MPVSCPKCGTESADGSKFCSECATPLPDAPQTGASVPTVEVPVRQLATGTVFADRYRIIEELGEGGMGRVYKAYDTKIREKVALKLVRPEIASDQRILERFANEVRLARGITHRNVCRMHDLGDEHGTPFITMEYVSGENLRSMIRMTGGLSPAQTVSIGRQIASGLAEAHRLGVIHRDLKPQNVMIDREGTARIMDFGIAHSMRTKGLTDRGASIGTPEYMSPEQAEGEDVDARSDIYSLGVILFEMATGKPPFQGRSALAVAMKHKAEPPPDPSVVNPRVPADLSRVILKCLEKDKGARYASADELGADLDRVAGELPAATPALPPHRTTTAETMRKARWRNALIPGVAVLIVAAVALVAWVLVGRRAPSTVPAGAVNRNAVAIVGFDNETGDARFDHLRKAIPRLLITSLENTGRFKVATWERMKDVLSQAGRKDVDVIDAEGGFQVCQREGIAFIVTGSFTKAGDVFATDAKILDARSRALVKSVTSRGEGENSILRTQLDEIGREIARGLAPAGDGPVRVQPLIDVTTGSMDAYAAYLRGINALDRLYYADAIPELKKAVEIDPQFAIAHSELASAYAGVRRQKDRDQEIELAMRHSAKATERERLRIEARYATYVQRDWDKRVASLKQLVARYPDDKNGYFELGLSYRARSMYDEAIRSFERALELDPAWGLALNEIAFSYVGQKKLSLAMPYLEKYAAVNPGDANPLDSIADVQLRMGRLDDAMAAYRRVLDIRRDFGCDLTLAAISAMKEDYGAAFAWVDSMISHAATDDTKAAGYGMRAILYEITGRPAGARTALQSARDVMARTLGVFRVDYLRGWIEYDNQAWAESRKAFRSSRDGLSKGMEPALAETVGAAIFGTVDAAEGKQASARSNLERAQSALARLTGPLSPAASFTIRRLQASVLAVEGKPDEAIAVLAPAWPGPLPSTWVFDQMVTYFCPLAQDDLARLYVRKRDWTRAIAEYKVLTVIGPGHDNRRLIHPIYHHRLAQVYEQAGSKAEAIAEYERFLKLWENAEGKRAEIGNARERLAALRAQRLAPGTH